MKFETWALYKHLDIQFCLLMFLFTAAKQVLAKAWWSSTPQMAQVRSKMEWNL